MATITLQGEKEKKQGIRYEFDTDAQLLGEGGMGKVFRGRQVTEATGQIRDVAIKFLYSDLPEQMIERARREAELRIKSDSLVEMMGFFEMDDTMPNGQTVKRYHVVSELLTGVTVEDLMHGKTTDAAGNEVPFAQKLYKDYINDPYYFAIYVVKNVLAGLMALHDAGYIHRDIDPTNIMITADEHIKLIDFGIAKQLKQLNSYDKALTSTGQFIGKAAYAAPEMVLGDIKSQCQSTDTYSVGILLFLCLVGHLPFEGSDSEVLVKQMRENVPLGNIRQTAMRKVIAKATSKKQAERYASAAEFRAALEKIADMPYPEKGMAAKKLYKVFAATALLGAIIAVALTCLGGSDKSDEPQGAVDVEKHDNRPASYADVLQNLRDEAKAKTGLQQLDSLVDTGHAEATYLASRLCFVSNSANDYRPDSIKQMQNATGVQVDHAKAHKLLLKTIDLNPDDYRALYELGCDYLGGHDRTNSVERDLDKANEYFQKAMEVATSAGDNDYIERIKAQMAKYNI